MLHEWRLVDSREREQVMGALSSPIVRKVQGLIALTRSDRIEEARTSALIACRLIEKHNLIVSDTPVPAEPRPYVPPEPTYSYRPPAATYSDRPARPRTIYAKHNGKCRDCGAWIYAGESCVWLKDTGIWHPECSP